MRNVVTKKKYVAPETAFCAVDCVLCTAGSGENTNWENDKETWEPWNLEENV